jgi:tRNA modification GTPase
MIPDPQDTIVALSTAPGPGGRAILRLSGPAALSVATKLFTSTQCVLANQRRFYVGEIQLPPLASNLPADLHVWPAPRTYTGQDLVELHTLSCPPLIGEIVSRLLQCGARAAQPGEFTLRAFLAGKLDLTQVEAVLAVVEAGDRTQLRQALAQLAGGLAEPLQGMREDLLNLLADVEAGLDFTDEDIEFVGQQELLDRLARALARLNLLSRQLDQRAVDSRPFRAVLVGRPNAGKSSLFNRLAAGATALVSPEPGTTRDYLVHRLEFDEHTIELVDTAGLQTPADSIGTQAQSLGLEQVEHADLLLLCLESDQPLNEQERALLARVAPPVVVGLTTKCDLVSPPAGRLATSAASGVGMEDVRLLLREHARRRKQPPLAPSLSRCRHHVDACLGHLRQAHSNVLDADPPELLAVELRGALDELGAMVGAVYADDLLDRIFSRFCIGK